MLKPKQKALAELMVLEPDLTNLEYAQRAKIDIKTLYKWKKTEEFKEYVGELCKDKFKDLEKLAIAKLTEQVEKGSFTAIKYILDSLGYAAPTKLETDFSKTININVVGDEDC